jgi:hypothetical protein
MNNDKIFKKCTGLCGRVLEANSENFYWVHSTNRLAGQCKGCSGKGKPSSIIEENGTKYQICSGKCGLKLELNEDNFNRENQSKTGFRKDCKICRKDGSLSYYQKNKDRILVQKQEYYEENKEELSIKNAIYYTEHREENLIKSKEYDAKPENKLKRNKRSNIRRKERRQNDPAYRLMNNVSRLVNFMLNSQGSSKMGESCKNYLPFTKEQLEEHVEAQFKLPGNEWMNWDNQGVYNPKTWDDNNSSTWFWHLDHIVSQARLKYDSMKHPNFKKCWSLDNLRPYSAKLNVIERDRK